MTKMVKITDFLEIFDIYYFEMVEIIQNDTVFSTVHYDVTKAVDDLREKINTHSIVEVKIAEIPLLHSTGSKQMLKITLEKLNNF